MVLYLLGGYFVPWFLLLLDGGCLLSSWECFQDPGRCGHLCSHVQSGSRY